MTLEEAKARLDHTLDEIAAEGISVWGWDDESIFLSKGEHNFPTIWCDPRHPTNSSEARPANAGVEVYDSPTFERFVRECREAGLEVEHYEGRFFYTGPAVRTKDVQEVIRATRVKVQWDNLGLGYIVYPK